jgi:ASC-1-like (ASCH) protein
MISMDKIIDRINIYPLFGNRSHLAICTPKITDLIMSRRKRVETRFSINKIMPYRQIKEGDMLVFKKVAGPIVGVAFAGSVVFYENLKPDKIRDLKNKYNSIILADNDFWKSKINSKYATFIYLGKPIKIKPFYIDKKDRRPWVILEG